MEFSDAEQTQLINVCKELGSKPKFDSKEEFIAWMTDYVNGVKGENNTSETKPQVTDGATSATSSKQFLPRIPNFSGATPTKSDHVPFEVWHYELQCLLREKRYPPESILHAARLSLRGDAGRIAVRLGTDATINQLLDKMKHLFGTVEAGEDLLARFYSASQRDDETVVQWSCRLEDYWQEIQQGKVKTLESNNILKNKFWNGLKHPLHELSGYKFDQNLDYEQFLVEVRKIEQTLSTGESKGPKKTGRLHVQQTQSDTSEETVTSSGREPTVENTAILNQLQTQVNNLTEQMSKLSQHLFAAQASVPSSFQPVSAGVPRPSYTPRPPPTCWNCGQVGHVRAVCTNPPLNFARSLPWGMQRPKQTQQPH